MTSESSHEGLKVCIQPPQPEPTLEPSYSVREIEAQDGAVLLDIAQGVCLGITPIGLKIWKLLKLQKNVEQITDLLAFEFCIPRQQIHDDAVAFIDHLKRAGVMVPRGLLHIDQQVPKALTLLHARSTSTKSKSACAKMPRLLVFKALLGLFVFDLLRIEQKFSKIHACVRAWPVANRPPLANLHAKVGRAVDYASIWYPKRVLCLQRSAVKTCLLRHYGISAHMVIGAKQLPFKAHAWTEVDGEPIDESDDIREIYLVWERC